MVEAPPPFSTRRRQHSPHRQPPTTERERRRRQRRAERVKQEKRVEAAAGACREVLTDGWENAVASRASGYITRSTWREVTRGNRPGDCQPLADWAAKILEYKKKVHSMVGALGKWLMSLAGGGRFAQTLADDLLRGIPLPVDAKFVAAARGLQVTGIFLCVAGGGELIRCPCFVALAINETKARVKQVLAGAIHDWERFGTLTPQHLQ